MFEKIRPEQVGVSPKSLIKFTNHLLKNGINMHSMIFMKDDKVFYEEYTKPFNENFLHRMYSQTKSFVSVAIGILVEEGKISLKDHIVDYFKEYIHGEVNPYLKEQTIEDMLMMKTCVTSIYWFSDKNTDNRLENYFNGPFGVPAGLRWSYDSSGSQVLSCLVEKISGMKFDEFLKEKIFKHLSTFNNAYCLRTPHDQPWGDSGFLCTQRDIASFGYLMMNDGNFYGKQLINRDYCIKAQSKLSDNSENLYPSCSNQGYGYQFWRYSEDTCGLMGMCDQLTFYNKEKHVLFSCTAGNQSNTIYRNFIVDAVLDIFDEVCDNVLPYDDESYNKLESLLQNQVLQYQHGSKTSPYMNEFINQKYILDENKMNIKWIKFTFDGDDLVFNYENAQGIKTLKCSYGKNYFEKFPEVGYSNLVGRERTKDYQYDCATSYAFLDEHKLGINVKIIDKYFGNSFMMFSFKDDYVYVDMKRLAEYFLLEYEGTALGHKEK